MSKFENTQLMTATAFGYDSTTKQSWSKILKKAGSFQKIKDKQQFMQSLKKNVDDCYVKMAGITFENLDDSMKYKMFFDNSKLKWRLELLESKDPEVLIDDKISFFHSDLAKKTAETAKQFALKSKELCDKHIIPNLGSGDFLEIDETKLEAIVTGYLKDDEFISKLGKLEYVK